MAHTRNSPPFLQKKPIPGVDRIIAIASGKGGVGKSNVTVNLAVTLAKMGLRVGILDADIYGPSIPMMLGFQKTSNSSNTPLRPAIDENKNMVPLHAHNVACMSIGFLVPHDAAAVWRGPMIQNAVLQLLFQVAWGDLDILLIDMPPGTGDIALTLAQQAYISGMIIVSTPQDLALIDAQKARTMAQRISIPCLGVIENMSSFQCPTCKTHTPIFHEHGAQQWSKDAGIPFLGAIPLDMRLRIGADKGEPSTLTDHDLYNLYKTIAHHAFQLPQ